MGAPEPSAAAFKQLWLKWQSRLTTRAVQGRHAREGAVIRPALRRFAMTRRRLIILVLLVLCCCA